MAAVRSQVAPLGAARPAAPWCVAQAADAAAVRGPRQLSGRWHAGAAPHDPRPMMACQAGNSGWAVARAWLHPGCLPRGHCLHPEPFAASQNCQEGVPQLRPYSSHHSQRRLSRFQPRPWSRTDRLVVLLAEALALALVELPCSLGHWRRLGLLRALLRFVAGPQRKGSPWPDCPRLPSQQLLRRQPSQAPQAPLASMALLLKSL